jgi:hypothetical protein
MIPSANEAEILYEFLRLRDRWPSNEVEIKGSRLDESQAAQVIELLCHYDVLVKFFAVDMATHADWNVEDFKMRQVANVTVNLTTEHHPNIVSQLEKLARTIREMPNQLFLQAFVTIQLILDIIEEGTLYYAQRLPAEIGDIVWIVDRKNNTITQMEEMWTMLILPASETHFTKTPLKVLRGADYSYFHERYGFTAATMSEETARHMEWLHETHGARRMTAKDKGIDSKLLLSDQRKFMDSRDSLGLQLADMLATILRRALNNHLQIQGWANLGRLLVHKAEPGSSFLQLGIDKDAPLILTGHAAKVCRLLNARAKSMLIDQD